MDSQEHKGLQRVRHELKADGIRDPDNNPLRSGIHSRGYLPHVKREGASYFVTMRLADSLPKQVLLGLKMESSQNHSRQGAAPLRFERDKEFRRQVERFLDAGSGECLLGQTSVAKLAAEALQHAAPEQYTLGEWVIMPNHVHMVLRPALNRVLSDILKGRKQYIAREANLLLGRTGKPFWQRESYDHWIRDDEEKARISRYIRNNPVKAGLCRVPEEWRWGSAWRAEGP